MEKKDIRNLKKGLNYAQMTDRLDLSFSCIASMLYIGEDRNQFSNIYLFHPEVSFRVLANCSTEPLPK